MVGLGWQGFTLSAHSVMPEGGGGTTAEMHFFGAYLQQDALDRADDVLKQVFIDPQIPDRGTSRIRNRRPP